MVRPTRLPALTSVTDGPAGWLAVGGPGPVVLTSADGRSWRRAAGPITPDLAGTSGVATAANLSGKSSAGPRRGERRAGPALWWSPNLTSWTRATVMNDTSGSSQISAVAADTHLFMAVGSHDGHPTVWTTTDGQTWTTIVLGLPPGASAAALHQVAINGDHVVALGLQTKAGRSVPFAELSADGGASWQERPFGSAGPGVAVTALTASSANSPRPASRARAASRTPRSGPPPPDQPGPPLRSVGSAAAERTRFPRWSRPARGCPASGPSPPSRASRP